MNVENPSDGDIALVMLLQLMAYLGEAGTLPAKQLDAVIELGCDMIGRERKAAGRVKRLRSYKAAWRSRADG